MKTPSTPTPRLWSRLLFTILAGLLVPVAASAAPHNPTVAAGSASVSASGSATLIHQSSNHAVINWSDFSIGSGETVQFLMPSASSAVLNRVTSAQVSTLDGSLLGNGSVYLINPNGIIIGPHGLIETRGFIAATLDAADNAFMAGKSLLFSGTSAASVLNQGQVQASFGNIALVARQVTNAGQLNAPHGSVTLAAGAEVLLQQQGMGATVRVTGDGSVTNSGAVNAVLAQLAANGGNAYALAINNSGIVRATAVQNVNGRILLTAGPTGAVDNTGTLDASSATGAGGAIQITGRQIQIESSSRLLATGPKGGGQILVGGSWKGLDPSVPEALDTLVASGALLDASATQKGNGGAIVVRSDVTNPDSLTLAYGTLLATGGPLGGNGGRIETSGYSLDTSGLTVSTAAPAGLPGEWLLDPYNVVISSSATSNFNTGGATWTPTASGGNVLNTTLDSALNGGSSITITTGSSGSDLGNLTVNAPITKSSGSTAVTLTLDAANNITVNSDITASSGMLNIVLDAHQASAGAIILDANLSTNGGSVSFGTGRTQNSALVGGDVYLNSSSAQTITTSGGSVTVAGQMLIANPLGLTISTSGGPVNFESTVDSGDTYTLVNVSDNWDTAVVAAASGPGNQTGNTYLATITSSLENTIAAEAANYTASWLGAHRVIGIGTNADWRWVTGPEGLQNGGQGLIFFVQNPSGGGNAVNGAFTNWNSGEPNNSGGGGNLNNNGESVLQFLGTTGNWNDLSETTQFLPYLKETNLAPSPLTVNAGAGAVTFGGLVGSNKPLSYLTVTGPVAMNGGGVTVVYGQTYNNPMTLGAASTVLNVTDDDLSLTNNISYSGSSAASLTLEAYNSVILNTGVAVSAVGSGALNVTLDSDTSLSSGRIELDAGAAITSNGGNIVLGGGADPSTGFAVQGIGIYMDEATLSAGAGSITLHGQAAAGSDGIGIEALSGCEIATTSGAITVVGQASGGGGIYGVDLVSGPVISTQTGAITITGTVTNAGDNSRGVDLSLATVSSSGSSAAGAVNITGAVVNSSPQSGDSHVGINLESDALITVNAANVTLTGTGGGGGNNNYGVALDGSTLESGGPGAIAVTGTGGQSTGTGNNGIELGAGSIVESELTGTGAITLTGYGPSASAQGSASSGVSIEASSEVGSINDANSAALTVTGTGGSVDASNGYNAFGVLIDNQSTVVSFGSPITITGTGGATGQGNDGVHIEGGSNVYTSASVPITITGTGGSGGGDGFVAVNSDTAVQVINGALHITGTGEGSGDSTVGVVVGYDAVVQSAGSGAITLTGTGAQSPGIDNHGIEITAGGVVASTGAGTGPINLTGYGAATTAQGSLSVGVTIDSGAVVESLNASNTQPLTITGTGASVDPSTGSDAFGVAISAEVSSAGSPIVIHGTGGATGANSAGVAIQSSGIVAASGAATLTITGTAGSGGGSGVLIDSSGTVVEVQNGELTITGTGGGAGDSNVGIAVLQSALVASTGSGAIALTGTGGQTSGIDNHGIEISAGAVVSSNGTGTGAITLTGYGPSTTAEGSNSAGVSVDSSALVESLNASNTQPLTITGTGAKVDPSTGSDAFGVDVSAYVSSAGSPIVISGTGGATGVSNHGVYIESTGNITATGSASISITGVGGSGGGGDGVEITGPGTIVQTAGGSLHITGAGGASGNDDNFGISVDTGALVATADGNLTLTGTGGGAATSSGNDGVQLTGSGAAVWSTGAGNIVINGAGGQTAGSANNGIEVSFDAVVQATNTGTGAVTLTGNGATATAQGSASSGVSINNGGEVYSGNVANTSSVTITGTGASVDAGAGNNAFGVDVFDGLIISHRSPVIINGTGGATGAFNHGVAIQSGANVTATGSAPVTIAGAGGPGGGIGVDVTDIQSSVSVQNGALQITGAGGGSGIGNDGIAVQAAAVVQSSGSGAITLTGTGGQSAGTGNNGIEVTTSAIVQSTSSGTAALTLTGNGATSSAQGSFSSGVSINAGAEIASLNSADTAGLTVTGTGASVDATAGSNAFGVLISDSSVSSARSPVIITGTGGATGVANFGVIVENQSIVSASGSTTLAITGAAGSGGGDGVDITSPGTSVQTAAGALHITGTGGGGNDDNVGISVDTGGLVATADGNLTLTGTGGGTASSSGNDGVLVSGGGTAVWSTGAGNIVINGTGGQTAGTGNNGIEITGAAVVQSTTTGTGAVTLTGNGATATAEGSSNSGISLNAGGEIYSGNVANTAPLTITGTGASVDPGIGSTAYGVLISGSSILSTNAPIMVTGTGGATGVDNHGILIDNLSYVSGAGSTSVTLVGAGGSGGGGAGVVVSDNGTTVSVVNGAVTMTGTGGSSGNDNYGVAIENLSHVQSSGAGAILVTGTGGETAGAANNGIEITGGANVESSPTGAGAITLTGHGATASAQGSASSGVSIDGAGGVASLNAANSAPMTITGTGASVDASTGSSAYGVVVAHASIESVGAPVIIQGAGGATGLANHGVAVQFGSSIFLGGSASLTITGTGGGGGDGVDIDGAGTTVSVQSGPLHITGAGGVSSDDDNIGIDIENGALVSTTDGNLTLTGAGGGIDASFASNGVQIAGSGTQVSSSGAGNILIIGAGGNTTGTGDAQFGVDINYSSVVESSDTGTITITGTGGGGSGTGYDYGVAIHRSTVTSAAGDITVTGTGNAGTVSETSDGISFEGSLAAVQSTGSANITLIGTPGAFGVGILAIVPADIGGASDTGNITLHTDSVSFDASSGDVTFQSSGNLLIEPITASTTIGLNAAGSLAFDSQDLTDIHPGFASVTFGRSDGAGLVTVGSMNFDNPLEITTGSGGISVTGPAAVTGNFHLDSAGPVTQTGPIDATNLVLTGSGIFTLNNSSNAVSNLFANLTGGALDFVNNAALTVGPVVSQNGITIQTLAGDLTLASAVTGGGGGNSIVLAAAAEFINDAGSSALTPGGSGRFLVYSTDPADTVLGGLTGEKLYNANFTGHPPASIGFTGQNVFLFSIAPAITVTANNASRVFGQPNPTLSYTIGAGGLIDGDTPGSALTGAGVLSTSATLTSPIGNYPINLAAGTFASPLGYALHLVNGNLAVTNPYNIPASEEFQIVAGLTLNPDVAPSIVPPALVGGTAPVRSLAGAGALGWGNNAADSFRAARIFYRYRGPAPDSAGRIAGASSFDVFAP